MEPINRRELVAGGLGVAAAALGATAAPRPLAAASGPPPASAPGWQHGPFDSPREFVAELERRRLVLRVPRIDQDAYEATALMYRLIDRFGMHAAPVLFLENVKIDGRWVEGPVIANQYGPVSAEAIALGVEPVPGDASATYRAAMRRAESILRNGEFPTAPPREVDRRAAPCKEVVVTGDAIDITRFAYIQSNPADAGRYINTGSVFTYDSELGRNFGTYLCQINLF